MRYCLYLIILLLIYGTKLSGQPVRFQYTYDNTMAMPFSMSGYDMAQDSTGIIYWASVDGVWAFDGFRTRLYRLDNSLFKEPQSQYVTSLYIDRYDVVWAGLRNGLARLNRETRRLDPVVISTTKTADIAFHIKEDARDNIWADTYDSNPEHGNATCYNRNTGKTFPYFIRLPNGQPLTERIEKLYFDEFGCRIITATGSFVVRPLTETTGLAAPLQWPGGSKNNSLRDLLAKDGNGNYWATDSTGQLWWGKSLTGLRPFETIEAVKNWRNPGLFLDRKNRVWIAGPQIAVFDPVSGANQFILPKTCDQDGFTGDYVHHIFHDRQNVHWVMSGMRTTGGNVQVLTEMPTLFGVWGPEEKPCHVFSIYREPQNGDFWVGTYSNGVYHLDSGFRKKAHYQSTPDGHSNLLTDKVIFLAPAGKEEMWFNCVPTGISRLNKKSGRITTLKAPDGQPYQECFQLHDGRLLLAAYNKSCIYDPATGSYRPNAPVPVGTVGNNAFRFIQAVEEDAGNVWFGGYDKHIHRLNLETGSLSTLETDHIQHNVMALHRRGDSLYVGMMGQGLGIYNIPEKRFVANFMTPEGFPHHTVYGILEDRKSRLWIFSSNGLTLFEPEQGRFTEFNQMDGLPWVGFHSGAYFQDNRGRMYGGDEGLLWFHPDSLLHARPSYLGRLAITDILVGGMSRLPASGEMLRLAPDENYLEIQFSNLDYGYPRIDSFWYKLEGVDENWHATSEPRAIFNRVPPGNYLFRLRGTNRFGVGGTHETQIRIFIEAWWWQSVWFRSVSLALLAAILWNVWKYYTGRKSAVENNLRVQMQLKSLEALRGQLNHHFVKNALGRSNAKVLSDNVAEANQFLGQFAKLMEMVLMGSRTDFYTFREEAAIMQLYLEIQRRRWNGVFETDFYMEPGLEEGNYYCPSLLVQPLAENAIEHGLLPKQNPPRKLSIRWEQSGGMLVCTVQDTGIGLHASAENTNTDAVHTGLANVRSRLDIINNLYKLNLKMTIEENPAGDGVLVKLYLPKRTVNPSVHDALNTSA